MGQLRAQRSALLSSWDRAMVFLFRFPILPHKEFYLRSCRFRPRPKNELLVSRQIISHIGNRSPISIRFQPVNARPAIQIRCGRRVSCLNNALWPGLAICPASIHFYGRKIAHPTTRRKMILWIGRNLSKHKSHPHRCLSAWPWASLPFCLRCRLVEELRHK